MLRTARDVYGEMTQIAPREIVERSIGISLVHRYVYVANPHVANVTIERTLSSIELAKSRIRGRTIDGEGRRSSPLLWPAQLPREMFNALMTSADTFVFSFVQSPYARVLSAYLRAFVEGGPDGNDRRALLERVGRSGEDVLRFDEFVDALAEMDPEAMSPHWRPQSLCLLLDAVDYSFIGRVEDFAHQFDAVRRRLFGKGRAQGPRRSATGLPGHAEADSRLAELYTPATQQKVRDLYRADFVAFGYPMDTLDPSPCDRGRVSVPVCRDARIAMTLAESSRAAGRSDEALDWYEEAEALGAKDACYWRGRLEEDRGAHDRSLACYRRGAEQGQVACMRGLARAYQLGRGVAADGAAERAWLERAADRGDARAALRLGALQAAADGEEAALAWYEKAAAFGAASGYYKLGRYHETHKARERSYAYFRSGAERGDVACMRGLARAYELGRGVERDDDLAGYWKERASPESVRAPAPAPGHFWVKLPRRVGTGDQVANRFLDILDGNATLGQRQLRRTGYGGYERDTAATLCAIFGLLADGAVPTLGGPGAFTFFDVGANFGHYALLCKSLWRDARVVAFEPAPETHPWLVRAAAANGLEIRAEAAAVGERSGEATLYISTRSDASNSLNPGFRAHRGEVSVRCVTLDGFCAATGLVPAVLKIDVETHENAVFEGGTALLREHRPFVVVEVLTEAGVDHGERLSRRMEAIGGYHYYRITDVPTFESSPAVRTAPHPGSALRDWLLSPIALGDEFFARLAAFRRNLSLCTAESNVPPPQPEG